VFPLKNFLKQNHSILHCSLKQLFQMSFYLWVYFVRKYRINVIGCISTMRNLTILLSHFRELKSWDSLDWRGRLSPLIWYLWLFPIRILKERIPWEELQVPKRGHLCGESDFDQNPIEKLSLGFDEWVERLQGCGANDMEYISVNICDLIWYLRWFAKSG
jgi:hypothetical protein